MVAVDKNDTQETWVYNPLAALLYLFKPGSLF
jgi:hypothetical protein